MYEIFICWKLEIFCIGRWLKGPKLQSGITFFNQIKIRNKGIQFSKTCSAFCHLGTKLELMFHFETGLIKLRMGYPHLMVQFKNLHFTLLVSFLEPIKRISRTCISSIINSLSEKLTDFFVYDCCRSYYRLSGLKILYIWFHLHRKDLRHSRRHTLRRVSLVFGRNEMAFNDV